MHLDKLLVQLKKASNLNHAKALIMSGVVFVNGEKVDKSGTEVSSDAEVVVKEKSKYVGRGALKLQGAFEEFKLNVNDLVCADVGSSTGGFTEVLLKNGAAKVYAIDVGYGELDYKLRKDSRVVVMERTSARYLECLPEKVSFITVDVSFISLRILLPVIVNWTDAPSTFVVLIKPQFEAKSDEVMSGGVVTDLAVHERVIEEIRNSAISVGLTFKEVVPSPILGSKGNQEYLAMFTKE